MHRARAFFFVCLGILCLIAAYHFGATSATAQAPTNPVVAGNGMGIVFTANGDVYRNTAPDYSAWACVGNVFGGATDDVLVAGDATGIAFTATGDVYRNTAPDYSAWACVGNVFGGAVSAQTMSMGQLKAKYATPKPTE